MILISLHIHGPTYSTAVLTISLSGLICWSSRGIYSVCSIPSHGTSNISTWYFDSRKRYQENHTCPHTCPHTAQEEEVPAHTAAALRSDDIFLLR